MRAFLIVVLMSLSQQGWSQDSYKVFGGLAYRNYLDGNFDEAIIYANRLIRDYPDSTLAHRLLAECYKSKGDFEAAVEIYTNVLDKGDSNSSVIGGRGRAYYVMDKIDLAEADFKTGMRLYPFDSLLRMNLATVYYHQKRFEETKLVLDSMGWFSRKYHDGYIMRADANKSLKHYEAALADYKAYIEKDSTQYGARMKLAECYKALGRNTEMCETLRDCYERTYIGSNEYFAGDCVKILDYYINPPPEAISSEDILPPPQEIIREERTIIKTD